MPRADCVFKHFAESDKCPSCGAQPLAERDFTELVVSDSTLAPNLVKTCFQTILSMRPNANEITFPEACSSILRQMEAMRTTTKFVLKQMIKDSTNNSQRNQGYGAIKQQNVDLKKQLAGLQDMHQRTVNELNNKLHNKEKVNAELQTQLQSAERHMDNFRRSAAPSPTNQQVPASRGGGPPLQGIIAQKQQREAQVRAQQEAMMTGRPALGSRVGSNSRLGSRMGVSVQPSMSRHMSGNVSYASPAPMHQPLSQRSSSYPGGGPMRAVGAAQRQLQQSITPMQNMAAVRPFSSNSNGSGNRVRELTATSGYNFTSSALGGGGSGGHINKRRRGTPTTPNSFGNSPGGGGYSSQQFPRQNRGPRGNPYNR